MQKMKRQLVNLTVSDTCEVLRVILRATPNSACHVDSAMDLYGNVDEHRFAAGMGLTSLVSMRGSVESDDSGVFICYDLVGLSPVVLALAAVPLGFAVMGGFIILGFGSWGQGAGWGTALFTIVLAGAGYAAGLRKMLNSMFTQDFAKGVEYLHEKQAKQVLELNP